MIFCYNWLSPKQSLIIGFGPHITVINHDETTTTQRGGVCGSTSILGTTATAGSLGPPGVLCSGGRGIITGAPSPHQLSRQGSSVESHASSVPIHYHTAECSAAGRSLHQPTNHSKVKMTLVILSDKRPFHLNYEFSAAKDIFHVSKF